MRRVGGLSTGTVFYRRTDIFCSISFVTCGVLHGVDTSRKSISPSLFVVTDDFWLVVSLVLT